MNLILDEPSYRILSAFGRHYRKNNVVSTFHPRYAVVEVAYLRVPASHNLGSGKLSPADLTYGGLVKASWRRMNSK
ncbi:MAG: hypothetical protein WA323_09965 [Candidatus Nitrosopolaris sp.]